MGQCRLALLTHLRHHQSIGTTAGRLGVHVTHILHARCSLFCQPRMTWPVFHAMTCAPTAQRHPHCKESSAVLNGAMSSCTVDSSEAPPVDRPDCWPAWFAAPSTMTTTTCTYEMTNLSLTLANSSTPPLLQYLLALLTHLWHHLLFAITLGVHVPCLDRKAKGLLV